MTEQELDEKELVPSHAIQWDKPDYFIYAQRLYPKVFDSSDTSCRAFNTYVVRVDGQLRADLAWKEAKEQADQIISKGGYILWEITLGLFNQLRMPLAHQTQYLSLSLSLEHFRDSLWKEFKDKSLGLIIFRGSADFSEDFPWNDQQVSNLRDWLEDRLTTDHLSSETGLSVASFEQLDPSFLQTHPWGAQLVHLFCRDVAVEYLALLATRLPDTLPCYVLLDASTIVNPLWQVQLLHPERFERLNLALKGTSLPFCAWGWEQISPNGFIASRPLEMISLPTTTSSIGVCLPPLEFCRLSHYEGLETALNQLKAHKLNFRLIPETHLITEWDGLDYLLYSPNGLSPQGKRKLQGFCAAGGTVVTVGAPLGLPYEISLAYFIETIAKNRPNLHF